MRHVERSNGPANLVLAIIERTLRLLESNLSPIACLGCR